MWKRIRELLASIFGPPTDSEDSSEDSGRESASDREIAKARARFWAELREGQSEADARSRS